MRPSTIWGQYIHTQGGRHPDPAYPTSSGKRWAHKKKKTVVTTMTYDHPDPFLVPTMGGTAAMHEDVDRGQAVSHQKQSMRTGHTSSLTPPGFVLNVHPNYIPFKLVDDKTGRQIPAKYVQLFLNNDDPYAYSQMSTHSLTFIAKIQATPDTNMWERPNYSSEDTQYFDGKYHNQAEVDVALARLCNLSLQVEVCRYQAARYNHQSIACKIDQLEGELYTMGMKKCASLQCLMATNAKVHIEAKRDEEGFVQVALPWEHTRNTLHVDDLDDGL